MKYFVKTAMPATRYDLGGHAEGHLAGDRAAMNPAVENVVRQLRASAGGPAASISDIQEPFLQDKLNKVRPLEKRYRRAHFRNLKNPSPQLIANKNALRTELLNEAALRYDIPGTDNKILFNIRHSTKELEAAQMPQGPRNFTVFTGQPRSFKGKATNATRAITSILRMR